MVGSSLLAILDDYAFNHIEGDTHFLLENIGNTICTQHYVVGTGRKLTLA